MGRRKGGKNKPKWITRSEAILREIKSKKKKGFL